MSVNLHQKNGRYYAVFYDPDQRPARRWVTLRTARKDVARQKLVQLEREHALGQFDPWTHAAPEAGVTVAEAARRFIRSRASKSAKTVRNYTSVLNRFARSLPADLAITSVQPRHIDSFVRKPGLADASRASYFRHLRAFFAWATTARLLKHNPLLRVEAPKVGRKEARFLTPSEVERVVVAIKTDVDRKRRGAPSPDRYWLADVVEFAVGTGLRLGEIVALRWTDVDLDHGFLTVRSRKEARTKSGHDRRVPLVAGARAVVERRYSNVRKHSGVLDTERTVFEGKRGGRLDSSFVSKAFKSAARAAKLSEEIHFHSLRHSAASWMVMRGVPLAVVQAVLGHADISVTMRYSHLAPGAMQAEMERAFGAIQRGETRVEEPAAFYIGSTNGGQTVHMSAVPYALA